MRRIVFRPINLSTNNFSSSLRVQEFWSTQSNRRTTSKNHTIPFKWTGIPFLGILGICNSKHQICHKSWDANHFDFLELFCQPEVKELEPHPYLKQDAMIMRPLWALEPLRFHNSNKKIIYKSTFFAFLWFVLSQKQF